MLSTYLEVKKCSKAEKKEILRFYKNNHYPASFMGYDQVYTLLLKNKTIGYGIISYITTNNERGLLHSLLIVAEQRNKGYAKLLIKTMLDEHKNIICFADEKLKPFYVKLGFKEAIVLDIPEFLMSKYKSYKTKNKNLNAFITRQ